MIKFVGSSLARATNDGFCARYGGEEFVLIFERADPEAARAMLDKVRTVIASRELKVTNTGQSLDAKLEYRIGRKASVSAVYEQIPTLDTTKTRTSYGADLKFRWGFK